MDPCRSTSLEIGSSQNNGKTSPKEILPPSQPLYVLRGHAAQVNVVRFIRKNSRLLTCDSDGWIIMWKTSSRRPVAVWKAHDNAILAVEDWNTDKIITHGRDDRLLVWKLAPSDEAGLSTKLPVETDSAASASSLVTHRLPWLLYSIKVNALNFCGFAMCVESVRPAPGNWIKETSHDLKLAGDSDSILLAVPSITDSDSIDIMQLPSGLTLYSSIGISSGSDTGREPKTGMAMSLCLCYHALDPAALILVAGYESGHVIVYLIKDDLENDREDRAGKPTASDAKRPEVVYLHKTHSQPVLSVAIPSTCAYFLSSSADSLIVKHPLPISLLPSSLPPKAPIQSSNSSGLSSSFASGLSVQLSSLSSDASTNISTGSAFGPPSKPRFPKRCDPIEILKTNHSSQQSLAIRNDDKIFATAGWDGRVRVYSAGSKKGIGKSKMKELAVLSWHKEGCYACGFGEMLNTESEIEERKAQRKAVNRGGEEPDSSPGNLLEVVSRDKGLAMVCGQYKRIHNNEWEIDIECPRKTIEQIREEREMSRHWVVAGSKDGKISLWEIY